MLQAALFTSMVAAENNNINFERNRVVSGFFNRAPSRPAAASGGASLTAAASARHVAASASSVRPTVREIVIVRRAARRCTALQGHRGTLVSKRLASRK